jgi:hypothetical protein
MASNILIWSSFSTAWTYCSALTAAILFLLIVYNYIRRRKFPFVTTSVSAIQKTYSLQEDNLQVDPILGKLYEKEVINRHLRDEICALTSPLQKRRALLNHLDGQPYSLLEKYVAVLEKSAKSECLPSHTAIACKLREHLHLHNGLYMDQESGISDASSASKELHIQSSIVLKSSESRSTDRETHVSGPSPPFSFQASTTLHPASSRDVDDRICACVPSSTSKDTCSQQGVCSLLEKDSGGRTDCIGELSSIARTVSPYAEFPSTPVYSAEFQTSEIFQSHPQNILYAKSEGYFVRLDDGSHTRNMQPLSGVDDGAMSDDDISPYSSSDESDDGDPKFSPCSQQNKSLMVRKQHAELLKRSVHQVKFKEMWDIYMIDIKGAKHLVESIRKDSTRALDFRISMTMAGRDYSVDSIGIINKMLRKTMKNECQNPEIFQCRLYCHLVDCYLNAGDMDNAMNIVRQAIQMVQIIAADVSSAWAWCMYAWILNDQYSTDVGYLPYQIEVEVEASLSRAVECANQCPELCWLSESVKLGKAHWHFIMVASYRNVWNDYETALEHLQMGRLTLENVREELLNTFGFGYYHALRANFFMLSGRRNAANHAAAQAVQFYFKVKRYDHALVVAKEIVRDCELESYIYERRRNAHMRTTT